MNRPSNSFKTDKKFDTAVLFLIFNRLDTTKLVFETIKKVKPPRIYIASDGARENNPTEKKVVQEVRDYLMSQIDWDCEVKTLFRDNNMGCKYAVSTAIDWFFKNEEMGIILEDDCVPVQSFYYYCEELLEKYKEDKRIWHISGNNFIDEDSLSADFSYYFGGIYGSIWGWASWRDRWNHYDVEIKLFEKLKNNQLLENCYDGGLAVKSRLNNFQSIRNGLDTWDYQWVFTRWINNGLTIIPSVNLVFNAGFGEGATHTLSKNDVRAKLKVNEIEFPLKHPAYVIRDSAKEHNFYKRFEKVKTIDKLKGVIKWGLNLKHG
jgi:hypothetical protein